MHQNSIYVAIEGPEGSGKSTLASALVSRMYDTLGVQAVATREQGGTRLGKLLREILLDPASAEMAWRTELLLNVADRAQHWAELIKPALSAGVSVVSDRSMWSCAAYQGYGRGIPVETVLEMCDFALDGHRPDLVIFVDAPDEVLEQRMRSRTLDRFESAGDAFHDRVKAGFRELARSEKNWVTINGAAPKNEVLDEALGAVLSRLRSVQTAG